MSDPIKETYRRTFDFALDSLIVTLKEAQDYLGGGQDNAAIGTMVGIDEQYADMQAALRLFRNSRRKP